jgi:hypothetical protein
MSDCPREQETLSMLQTGRWPDGCDDNLRAHAAVCDLCAGIIDVASLIAADYHSALHTARVPASGLIWWRMQRRARQEAARTASRIITIVQAIAVAAGVAVAIGIIAATNRAFAFPLPDESRVLLAQWGLPLLIALASWLALAPVALYFAVSND